MFRSLFLPLLLVITASLTLVGCSPASEEAAEQTEDVVAEDLEDAVEDEMSEAAGEASDDAAMDDEAAEAEASDDEPAYVPYSGSADFSSHSPQGEQNGTATVNCARPRGRMSANECERWQEYFASLDQAAVDIDAPGTMWRGERATITVTIPLDAEAEAESREEGAQTLVEAIPVTPIMGAHLRSPDNGFEIRPATTGAIDLPDADPDISFIEIGFSSRPTWKWEVEARGSGPHSLDFEFFLVPDREGTGPGDASYFKDEKASITINVRLVDSINDWIDRHVPLIDNLTQLLVALTALVAALYGLWRAIRNRGQP